MKMTIEAVMAFNASKEANKERNKEMSINYHQSDHQIVVAWEGQPGGEGMKFVVG